MSAQGYSELSHKLKSTRADSGKEKPCKEKRLICQRDCNSGSDVIKITFYFAQEMKLVKNSHHNFVK